MLQVDQNLTNPAADGVEINIVDSPPSPLLFAGGPGARHMAILRPVKQATPLETAAAALPGH